MTSAKGYAAGTRFGGMKSSALLHALGPGRLDLDADDVRRHMSGHLRSCIWRLFNWVFTALRLPRGPSYRHTRIPFSLFTLSISSERTNRPLSPCLQLVNHHPLLITNSLSMRWATMLNKLE